MVNALDAYLKCNRFRSLSTGLNSVIVEIFVVNALGAYLKCNRFRSLSAGLNSVTVQIFCG